MPIYEYICLKCNNQFSMLQSLHPEQNDTECPRCSSREVKKTVSSFSCSSGAAESSMPAMPASGPACGMGGG